MRIKLLIACENENLGLGLSNQLTQGPASDIAGATSDLAKLHATVASTRPDVLLLEHSPCGKQPDLILPPLLRLSPATRILLLCEGYTDDLMIAFIKLGASGCLLASDNPSLILKAVRAVHGGDTWFGRSTLLLALRNLIGEAPAPIAFDDKRLTPREGEIFDLVGLGLTNKEVARKLDISDHTVKTHLHRIYVKLHQSGRYKALLSQPSRLSH
jgi:DNA-binding NarL/FixJ family response regulator